MHEKNVVLHGCQAASIPGMIAALFIPKVPRRVFAFGTCAAVYGYCSYLLQQQQQQQLQDYAGIITATRELYEAWDEAIARLNANGQRQTTLNHEQHSFQQ